MTTLPTLHTFSNRHIMKQVKNIKSGDYIFLENQFSKKRWSLMFKYNNINEADLNITYITNEEYFNLQEPQDDEDFMFDAVVGNPPFSKNNKGKGGTSIYQEFSVKAMKLAPTVAFVTPGSFENGDKFKEMRDMMDANGVQEITPIPLETFGNANIVRPCYWVVGNGDKTVNDFFTTPVKELFKKITENTKSYTVQSGRGDVSTSGTENLSFEKTETHPHVYVDRVKKEGPMHVYCNSKINMGIDSPLMVFAQRGGLSPKMFYEDTATSYSQNVIGIRVKNKTEFDNLKTLMETDIYKFMLLQLSGGKVTTKAGFPGAFTKGKIENLPALDLNVVWTDTMLEQKFNITTEEMDIIKEEIS